MSAPDPRVRTTTLALLGLLLLCVAAFFTLMERVEIERPRGPIGVARTDPSWAARALLEARGVPTEVGYGLGPLPPHDVLLIVWGNGPEAQAALAPRLAPWVEAGGHLVVVSAEEDLSALVGALAAAAEAEAAEDAAAREAPPLPQADGPAADPPDRGEAEGDAVTGEAEDDGDEAENEAEEGDEDDDGDEAEDAPQQAELREPLLTAAGVAVWTLDAPPAGLEEQVLVPDGPPLTVIAGSGRSLAGARAGVEWVALSPRGARVWARRQALGAGLVTTLADSSPLLLPSLQTHPDGAPLLWSLTAAGGQPKRVRVVLQGSDGSIWGLLLERAPAAVLCAAFAALVGLWRLRAHFGPQAAEAAAPRRGLVDHIDAVGAFLYLRVGADPLLDPMRRAALRAWERSLPGLSALPPAGQAEALAPRTGLGAPALEAALSAGPRDAAALVADVAALSALHRRARRAG